MTLAKSADFSGSLLFISSVLVPGVETQERKDIAVRNKYIRHIESFFENIPPPEEAAGIIVTVSLVPR
jgi:hypothetical protein